MAEKKLKQMKYKYCTKINTGKSFCIKKSSHTKTIKYSNKNNNYMYITDIYKMATKDGNKTPKMKENRLNLKLHGQLSSKMRGLLFTPPFHFDHDSLPIFKHCDI